MSIGRRFVATKYYEHVFGNQPFTNVAYIQLAYQLNDEQCLLLYLAVMEARASELYHVLMGKNADRYVIQSHLLAYCDIYANARDSYIRRISSDE